MKTTTQPDQKWWRKKLPPDGFEPAAGKGQSCPKCLLAELDYDTLFRLSCPICGFVAECGAFT